MPPVSTREKVRPHHSPSPKILSRVTPGVSSTMDSRCPTILLNSVDLPTLGRPTMATIGFAIVSPILSLSNSPGRPAGHRCSQLPS